MGAHIMKLLQGTEKRAGGAPKPLQRTNPLSNTGVFLDEKAKETFLYQSLKKSRLQGELNYFERFEDRTAYSRWVYPIFCDITLFDNFERTIGKRVRQMVENGGGHYFFDMSIEAMPYGASPFMSAKFKSFHEMLAHNNIPPDRVFYANANLVSDWQYDNWRRENGVEYRIENTILTHHYALGGFWQSFSNYFQHERLFSRNIELALDSIRNKKYRKYHYTCLALRPRPYRKALMLHLCERGFLDKGIVSYLGEDFGHQDAPTVETPAEAARIIGALPSGARLLSTSEALEKRCPITLDMNTADIRKMGWAPKELGFFPRPFIEDTRSIESRSYVEIVAETYFSDETCLYMTEKTLWAMMSLQPFIMVGSPFSLRYLRDLGFQTFSPLIDETYDDVSDPAQRMELIFAEIDRLCNMSTAEIHALYTELWPRVLHNYLHYFRNGRELVSRELQKRITHYIG